MFDVYSGVSQISQINQNEDITSGMIKLVHQSQVNSQGSQASRKTGSRHSSTHERSSLKMMNPLKSSPLRNRNTTDYILGDLLNGDVISQKRAPVDIKPIDISKVN